MIAAGSPPLVFEVHCAGLAIHPISARLSRQTGYFTKLYRLSVLSDRLSSKAENMHGKLKSKGLALTLLHVRVRSPHATLGRLVGGGVDMKATIGRSGLTARKREGDGGSPRGRFRIVGGFYRPDRFRTRPRAGFPLLPLRPDDGWCDDPADRNYNRPVHCPYPKSHEAMWRDDHVYDVVLVLDFNLRPRVRNGGSAIFFHLARPDFRPTAGCLALSRADMLKLLPRLSTRTHIAFG